MTEIEKVEPGRSARAKSGGRPTAASLKAEKAQGSAVPAGVTKPADHQSAKTDVKPPKEIPIEWRENPETKEPYRYVFHPEDFDDLDYVDALISMETASTQGEASAYAFKAVKAVLGPQYPLWRQREIDTQGRATFTESVAFFNSMMEQLKKGNYGPSPEA